MMATTPTFQVEAPLGITPAPSEERYRFSGHQTFPFRYPWLPKAVRGVSEDRAIFAQDDAMVTLGVGKNMVASMRYWAEALNLITFGRTAAEGKPTWLGEELLGDDGWDPYLEDVGTLWLLHWQLVESANLASTWHLVFTRWYKDAFTREEIAAWLAQLVEQLPGARASLGTLRRDVDTFVRTYLPAGPGGRRALEESFDCPLVELGLLREIEEGLLQFVRGPKATLPIEIFAYSLSRFWERTAPHQRTLSFERILYGPGSPGAAFKLSEPALVALLEKLPAWTEMRYDETAGLREVLRTSTQPVSPRRILETYYVRIEERGG
jgi:hypothetical protein